MSHSPDLQPGPQGNRRDFIYYATASAGAVVAGAAVWPLVNSMNPSADVLALSSIRVDVAGVTSGTQLTVLWQGRPVFLRARSAEEIAAAREVDVTTLPDNDANNANLAQPGDASDANRTLAPFAAEGAAPAPDDGTWLVQMGVCTHLGCVPLGESGDFGGWFCPCHGSHYDTAGRIRRGPAPRNLPIPVAAFVDPTTIQLG